MELYSIYQIVSLFFGKLVTGDEGELIGVIWDSRGILISLLVSVSLFLVFFILQGVGLYTMAKRRGLKHKWRAFFPFVNTYFIGKLAGECSVFGHKMKRAGLYVMLVEIAVFIVCAMDVTAQFLLFSPAYVSKVNVTESGYFWSGLSGFMVFVENFYRSSELFISLLSLAYQILTIILVMAFYKKYFARGFMILTVVTGLQPLAKYICIFVLRKNDAVDYEAYAKAKREEYFRRQQEQYQQYQQRYGNNPYGNNPYGNNPYGPFAGRYNNPYGPYQNGQNPQNGGQNYGQNGDAQPKAPEEPFGEFSGGNGEKGTNGDGGKSNGDGLFD